MKRIALLLLAALLVCFSFAACVGQEAVQTEPSTEPSETVTVPETQIPAETVPDTVVLPIPELPAIEMPTKPDADVELPPGEKPTVPLVNK